MLNGDYFRGPGGTKYDTVFANGVGRVGVADIGQGRARVRVESPAALTFPDGWTSPEGTNRRWSVVLPWNARFAAINDGITRLGGTPIEAPAPPPPVAAAAPKASFTGIAAKLTAIAEESDELSDQLRELAGTVDDDESGN